MRLKPLHADFGVEVTGFDIENGSSPDDIAALREAYDDYAMLLFRGGGQLSPERHVEIAGWFGPPPPVDDTGTGSCVGVLQNHEAAGSTALPFHSDLTYTDDPIRAICLQAVALPNRPTTTIFVSGAAAWENLPGALQGEIDAMSVRHILESSALGMDWPTFVADHPLKFLHPRSRRPILFATEHHATRVPELAERDSRALLDRLFRQLYAWERRYVHVWELHDVLLWDNLILQHARPEESDPADGSRTLQRVALSNVTLQETVDIARSRENAASA